MIFNQTFSALAFALSAAVAQAQEARIGGCAPGDFVADPGGAVRIAVNGRGYTPKCLKVKKGTVAVFEASSEHPLQGVATAGVVNPIFDELGGAVQPKTVTFTQAGTFAYFCVAHGDESGAGMSGAIMVE